VIIPKPNVVVQNIRKQPIKDDPQTRKKNNSNLENPEPIMPLKAKQNSKR
jgi:hypothetical protein